MTTRQPTMEDESESVSVERLPVPRQNRVTPFGQIVAVPERGTVMGNRGRLHDGAGRILRPWHVRRWLLCKLEFNGRRRTVMAPGRYTELFFLDEATGLAAGHRPCFECRRKSYRAFVEAWAVGNGLDLKAGLPSAPMIDDRLHEERVGPVRGKRTFRSKVDDLPDGVFLRGTMTATAPTSCGSGNSSSGRHAATR